MRSINALAWRNLTQNRSRALLSGIAVSFGVAMTVTGSMVAASIRKGMIHSEEMRVLMKGLIDQLDPLLIFISLVIGAAAAFLIFNSFSMSLTQKRREIGALRTLGMTRRQIMRLITAEAGIIGLGGTLIGLIAGPVLGQLVIKLLGRFGGGLFVFQSTPPPLAGILLAAGLGLAITQAAVLMPARRAASTPPLAALREADSAAIDRISHRPGLIALVFVIALFIFLVVAPPGQWTIYPSDIIFSVLLILVWLAALTVITSLAIEITARLLQNPLTRRYGATGRLITDNIQRGRQRVTLTVLTMAFALTVTTGLSGFITFMVETAFGSTMRPAIDQEALFLSRINIVGGWADVLAQDLDTLFLASDDYDTIASVVEGRAVHMANYFAIVPELSFMVDSYFSYVVESDKLDKIGPTLFSFTEGSWEEALPIMESGCGVLIAPLIATRNQVEVGDTLTVTGTNGPVDCVVGGIGSSVVNASVISYAAGEEFGITNPAAVLVVPNLGVDVEDVLADLQAALPELTAIKISLMFDRQLEFVAILSNSLGALLLLAVIAAAMGVVNTTLMSIHERQRELGLLRAVGSTRRQVRAVIMGEAALMGLLGGAFGFIAGVGFVLIFVVTYGGNSWGISFPLWATALKSVKPALLPGIAGLIAAPLIAAAAAWLPASPILRKTVIGALTPENDA